MMYQPSIVINLSALIACTISQGKHYGCYEGDSCALSSEDYTFSSQDIIYCTSSINTCTIYCLSPNSCQSLTIYSAADTTNIICNSTESCYESTIRIGDTSVYPLSFKSHHFTNNNPMTANIKCSSQESCSFLGVYFDGTEYDECTISSTHWHSFYNGYFDCNIDINHYTNTNDNKGCNLFCGDVFNNECFEATMDCNDADPKYCKCHGNNCILQQIVIYSHAFTSTSLDSLYTSSTTASNVQLFESLTFKLILIALIIIIVLLGCLLIICCWKFEVIYDFVQSKKNKNNEIKQKMDYNYKATASRPQRVPTNESIDNVSATHKNEMKATDEIMPSTWHKYKKHKESTDVPPPISMAKLAPTRDKVSPDSVISVLSQLSAVPSEKSQRFKHRIYNKKKPTKQNKNKKRRNHKDKEETEPIKEYETDSETVTTSTEIDGESNSSNESDTDSSATESSSSSSEEVKDGDGETQTHDDMVVNMVLMIQNTQSNKKDIGYNDSA